MSLADRTDHVARAMLDAGAYASKNDKDDHDGWRLFVAVRDLMVYSAGIGYDPRYLAEQASSSAMELIFDAHRNGELPRVPKRRKIALADAYGFSETYGAFECAGAQRWSPRERLAAFAFTTLRSADAEDLESYLSDQ